jgi:hypothetical protein
VVIQLDGAPKREGVSFFREVVRSRVRFLGIVRVLACLGGRSTCVEAPLQVSRSESRSLLVNGSNFPLGQGKKG